MKKFDFGHARMVTRDPVSGLLFIPYTKETSAALTNKSLAVSSSATSAIFASPMSTGVSPTKSSSIDSSMRGGFAIVDVCHKLTRLTKNPKEKQTVAITLCISQPQLYEDTNRSQSLNITAIGTFPSVGCVITADESGCLSVWNLNESNLEQLQESTIINNRASLKVSSNTICSDFGIEGKPDENFITFPREVKRNLTSEEFLNCKINATSSNITKRGGPISDNDIDVSIQDCFEGQTECVNCSVVDDSDTSRSDIDELSFTDLEISDHQIDQEIDMEPNPDPNIRPFPVPYPYDYDGMLNSAAIRAAELEAARLVAAVARAERIARKKLERARTLEANLMLSHFFDHEISGKKLQASESDDDSGENTNYYVGDEHFRTENDVEQMSDNNELGEEIKHIGSSEKSTEDNNAKAENIGTYELMDNTLANSITKIPIPGLMSWVNVFREAEEEAKQEEKTRLQAMLDQQPEESDPETFSAVTVEVISHQFPVRPILKAGKLVVTDGSFVLLKDYSETTSNEPVFLARPKWSNETPASPCALASVLRTSLSPCGSYIAVVTWTKNDGKNCRSTAKLRSPFSELIVWKRFEVDAEPSKSEWRCVGTANLYDLAISPVSEPSPSLLLASPIIRQHSHISWREDGSLVVIVPIVETEIDELIPATEAAGKINDNSKDADVDSTISDNDLSGDMRILVSCVSASLLSTTSNLTISIRDTGSIVKIGVDEESFEEQVLSDICVPLSGGNRIIVWGGSFIIMLNYFGTKECIIEWSEVIVI